MDPTTPDFCRRCGAHLVPGHGDFYVVRIEAFADPAPPAISAADFGPNHHQTIATLMAQLEGFSERELLDMVYRKMSFLLCGPCYRRWIEDPTG